MVADDAHQRVAAVGAIVVLLAVVLRLARFSCVTVKDGTFQGMPSPFGALTVVSIVLLELPFVATLMAIIGTAWLMVSRVEYPKPRGRLAVAMLASIHARAWHCWRPGRSTRLVVSCGPDRVCVAARGGEMMPFFAHKLGGVNNFRDNRREAGCAAAVAVVLSFCTT